MATKPMSDVYATTEHDPKQPRRSAWWAELALGIVCSATSVAFALGYTAIGPFSNVIIIYPSVVSAAYLVLASCLALVFLRAGYGHSPWSSDPAGSADDETVDLSVVDGPVGAGSSPTRRSSGQSGERGDDR